MIRISVGMGGFLMWVGGCGSDGLGFSDGMMIGIGSLKASAAVGRGIYARRFKIYLCLSGINAPTYKLRAKPANGFSDSIQGSLKTVAVVVQLFQPGILFCCFLRQSQVIRQMLIFYIFKRM